jgi:hypothetical protein
MGLPRVLVIICCLNFAVARSWASQWSEPVNLVGGYGRLAVGNRLHVVGHTGGNLVHRSSANDGETWSAATTISAAANNFPMQYGEPAPRLPQVDR